MTDPESDLRVLFLTTAYPAYEGDPRGHHVHSLSRQLVAAGVGVGVVSPILPGAKATDTLDGIDVHRFRYSPLGREQLAKGVSGIMPNLKAKPTLGLQIAPFIMQMRRAAGKNASSYDLIHAHWLYPTGTVALRVGKRRDLPVVVTAHGGDVNAAVSTPGLRSLVKWVGNSVDRVLAVSEDLVEKLVSIGIDRHQIEFVPLGVDATTKPDRAYDRPIPRAVFVGSLIRRKGVDTLINAVTSLPTDTIEVEIVGDGPERDVLERLAVGASGAIAFRGALAPEEAAAALHNADLLVLPSKSEGRPVVVMEAMAAGVMVVASDIPGTRELITHGKTGLLFNPDAVADLAVALSTAAQDPALRQRLGTAGRDALNARGLTGAAAAQRHLRVYREVLQARVDRPGPHRKPDA